MKRNLVIMNNTDMAEEIQKLKETLEFQQREFEAQFQAGVAEYKKLQNQLASAEMKNVNLKTSKDIFDKIIQMNQNKISLIEDM